MSLYTEFIKLSKSHRVLVTVVFLLLVINGIYGQFRVLFKYNDVRMDLPTFYTAAKICEPSNDLYDYSQLKKAWQDEQVSQKILPYVYPPFFASILKPVTLISFNSFQIAWLLFDYLMLSLLLGLVIKLLLQYWEIRAEIFVIPMLIFMVYSPIERNLICGQTNLLITALLLGMFLSEKRERQGWAGILLALSVIIKLSPAIFMVYFAFKRKWSAIVACLITLLILFLISLPFCGLSNWSNFFGELFPKLGMPENIPGLDNAPTQPLAEYSLMRFLKMLFYSFGVVDFTTFAQIFHKIISAIILIFTFYRIRDAKNDGSKLFIHYQLLICVMLIISPMSHHTHFVFLLPGFVFLLYRMLKVDFRLSDVLLLSVSFLLIAQSDILPRIPMGEHRILYLLKPVKFYGLIMLYAYLLMMMNRREITDKAIETNVQPSSA